MRWRLRTMMLTRLRPFAARAARTTPRSTSRRASWSAWSAPMAAARPACSTRSPASAARRARSTSTASIRAGSARRSGRRWLTYLPATRDVPWPLLRARPDRARRRRRRDLPALELEPLLDRRVDTPVDRRAQPGADRPRAGAAAEAAAARRADRQSRSALADPADGAGPRGDRAAAGAPRWSRSTISTRPSAMPTG